MLCANLDTENSRTVLDLFRIVNRDFGQTIVMVSHEPWHQSYFDRIIFIRTGCWIWSGWSGRESSHDEYQVPSVFRSV